MTSIPADTFTRERPDIGEKDAVDAAQRKRIIQSFSAHPILGRDGSYDAIAIKWKMEDGTTETMLIGHYAASVLQMLFSQIEAKWTEPTALPPDTTRR